MRQDILTFWNNLPSFVPFITAIGALLTAVFTGLLYRGRHELPGITSQVVDYNSYKADNYPDLVGRFVSFYLPTGPARRWLIDEIRITKSHHKWIARAEEGQWQQINNFIGYPLSGDWTDRIKYDPPIKSGDFLLHPDAPKHLRFSFRVCLRYRFRVKRWVDVIPDS